MGLSKYRKENWELSSEYQDENGDTIACDNSDCSLGYYLLDNDGDKRLFAPACATCEYSGDLRSVQRPADDDSRYIKNAPEDFKVGASRAMVKCIEFEEYMIIFENIRPETVNAIRDYARE